MRAWSSWGEGADASRYRKTNSLMMVSFYLVVRPAFPFADRGEVPSQSTFGRGRSGHLLGLEADVSRPSWSIGERRVEGRQRLARREVQLDLAQGGHGGVPRASPHQRW